MTEPFDLTGRVAIVTGANTGIGQGVAIALASAGADLALVGRSSMTETADAVRTRGRRAVEIQADLSTVAPVATVIAETLGALGDIDILVNNAGITRDGLAMRMKDEDWNAVIDVNLTAGFRLARAAMRGMMKKRWGRIVNITSVVGVTGNPGQANYVASKAGVIGLTKSLAQELASRNVTVNAVAPGFIATPMTDVLNDKQREGILGRVPAGRLGSSDEIAAAVLYLVSDEAGYVTGQTLHVNGGMAMI